MARRKRVTRRSDSPNWIPIVNAHQSLCGLTGNRQLAAKDLTNALADRDVPSMRRCFSPAWWRSPPVGAVLLEPDGELLPAAYWTEHEVQSWSSDATFVASRGNRGTEIMGYAYFVWKPALAKIWPAAFCACSSAGSAARSPHQRQTATQGISHPGCDQADCRPRVAGRT
jgi:hypothetical protein